MKALVYTGPKSVEIRDTALPRPKPGEVLLKMQLCGVCGTDIGIHSGTHPRAAAPLILGHEFVGEVVEAGARFARGQRVVAYPLLSCGVCHPCRTGSPHVCTGLRLIGIDQAGGLAEYLSVPEDMLFAVPEDMDNRIAALVEPLAVALRAVEQSGLGLADRVAVLGAGPIGLLTALAARQAGAAEVLVSDIDPARLALAGALGFRPVDLRQDDLSEQVQTATDGDGVDVVFECAGVGPAARDMTRIARPGGTICLTSLHKAPCPVALLDIAFKELRLIGSRVYTREQFRRSITLAQAMAEDLERVITRTLPLSGSAHVFDLIAAPEEADVKILIDCTA
ncbi:MAG: alcohol dehydrogenase catalytic domain-containing protein [Marinovum algicola]|uniref:2-desacetyl-2-hydroxyethyl bacteriochlorophyllide A dehydrogenase n=1 Tax=Marinovum algicola TaxID=42444 RepID=A0A975WF44_9RHOB|nr:alcohol dehydrogenase catalytic domain-containing protein [Marinovum algicola]SEK09960.1 2-desacetyl-2-hydroxyethyl bacteriochlorophyllide A dehydrogenase [Marinovum algicola]SLN77011.1 putative zinc-type alcohol dehydrogenase-like protein YjmD [Marinovum algicola]